MNIRISICTLCCLLLGAPYVSAGLIDSGSVQITFDNNSALFSGGGGPLTLDSWYGNGVNSVTLTEIVTGLQGDDITIPSTGLVTVNGSINGGTVTNPAGRTRESTNLDVDFAQPLATWSTTEAIGFDGILRTPVAPANGGGTLALGDWSLVYQGGILALVDDALGFPATTFTISAPTLTSLSNGFTLTGNLLVGDSLELLLNSGGYFGAPTGSRIGAISLTALAAVPEPSSLAGVGVAVAISSTFRRWRTRRNTR